VGVVNTGTERKKVYVTTVAAGAAPANVRSVCRALFHVHLHDIRYVASPNAMGALCRTMAVPTTRLSAAFPLKNAAPIARPSARQWTRRPAMALSGEEETA